MAGGRFYVVEQFHSALRACLQNVRPGRKVGSACHEFDDNEGGSMCPGTDISVQVPPISVKFCMMVYMCPGSVFSPSGAVPPRTSRKWLSRSVTFQLELNISSTRAF